MKTLSVLAATCALTAGACSVEGRSAQTAGGPPAAVARARTGSQDTDLMFIRSMIDLQSRTIEATTAALAQTSTQAIHEVAWRVRSVQLPELLRLREWQAAWDRSGSELVSVSNPGSASGGTAILEHEQGTDFDWTFVTTMLEHHRAAIAMAEAAWRTTDRTEVRTFAANVIQARRAELTELVLLSTRGDEEEG